MSICFPYSLKYSELSNWVFLCMICDNYLFVRIVYNYVTCVEGSFTRIFSFLCIQMYQTFLLLLLGFVPYQEGSSPFLNHTYKKKKIINCVFFMHLLFGVQIFNSSGIYFGGRLWKVIYFVFPTVLPVPIQVIELLHQWSEIPAFSYPKFQDRAEFMSRLSLLSYWLTY